MRKLVYGLFWIGWLILLLWATAGRVPARLQQEAGAAYVLSMEGPITPAMAEYLERGLTEAREGGASLLIFQLDTPGGQVDIMNRMVRGIRSSTVPVVIYIAPSGAIAGSAGTVITLAGHAAAMAPETAIGAASPVGGQGEDLGETVERKQVEILKAEVRSLAARRGARAVELAEATIEEAAALSAQEALEGGLIDFIASDRDQLLDLLDGFEVIVTGERITLHTADLELREIEPSPVEAVLQTLTNPNLVFLLITLGINAVLIEISNPGGWVAGFIGVVSLALAFFGLGVLPVNWFGLVFILTSFVLFFLEVKAPTHGALTVAGLSAFIAGALVLFNSPGTPAFLQVSIPLVVGVALLTAALAIAVLGFAIRSQRKKVETGSEGLIGQIGKVRSELNPEGMVFVAGELWKAVAEGGVTVPRGEEVEVIGVKGLQITVRSTS